jgi:hypothetical protein
LLRASRLIDGEELKALLSMLQGTPEPGIALEPVE